MTDCVRRISRPRARSLLESIAGAAHGADRVAIGASDQRLSEPSHVDVDGAPVDEGIAPPHAVEQLLARKDAAGVLHEKSQQFEFGGSQANLALAAGDAVRGAVEDDVAGAQD